MIITSAAAGADETKEPEDYSPFNGGEGAAGASDNDDDNSDSGASAGEE